MKSFSVRAISAVIAIGLIYLLYFFFQDFAFKILVALAVLLGSFEVSKLLFPNSEHKALKLIFHILAVVLSLFSYMFFHLSGTFLSLAFLGFTCFAIIFSKEFVKIDELKHWILSGILGLFYAGFLPVFVAKLLNLPSGPTWFLSLLVIIFAGDIGAYLFGVTMGKKKIFPQLSPKKSWMGALGGIIFSGVAAFLMAINALDLPSNLTILFIGLSLVSAIFAQLGDFFESLLKRVADVKDSGKIMPGHGGVLDRIDGVLFAAPVFYLGAVILQHYLP